MTCSLRARHGKPSDRPVAGRGIHGPAFSTTGTAFRPAARPRFPPARALRLTPPDGQPRPACAAMLGGLVENSWRAHGDVAHTPAPARRATMSCTEECDVAAYILDPI